MTFREAGRTCLLSKRWRDLWRKAMRTMPDLFLDDVNVMEGDYTHENVRLKSRMTLPEKKILHNQRVEFSRLVEQILRSHQTLTLNSFRLRFHLDVEFSVEIDRWIQIAIAKRAKKLDINLSEFRDYRYLNPCVEDLYTFPHGIFSTETTPFVKYLSLNNCICAPPHDFSGFRILIELRLETVYISDKDIEQILLNSSYLERLSIINCWNLDNLKIVGANLVLKYLRIAECYSLLRIEIDAAKLTTFQFYGIPVGLSFRNVPQLVDVAIYTVQQNIVAGISYALGTLSTDLRQIESLLLHSETIEKSMVPALLPAFSNLKQLSLMVSWVKGSLFGFFTILQGAPHLERFELHLPLEVRKRKVKKVRKPCITPLVHLKEVVFSGLIGNQDEVDFAMHLISHAEGIKTVAILSADRSYHYDTGVHVCDDGILGGYSDSIDTPANRRYVAGFVGEQVQNVIPPGAKLIIK
ncbi:hypothetical protein ACHQM5_018965 [Ranunculus cassubicifolius]